VLLNA
jgi:hypothetical protein